MKKVIEQPGIVNLNIEVFIDDDLDITLSQSNSFTHDEIRIIKSKSREVALAICPDFEREVETLQKDVDRLKKSNFWKRLELFVKQVNVKDPMSEEEKQFILYITNEALNK